jgi:hypothetical protein
MRIWICRPVSVDSGSGTSFFSSVAKLLQDANTVFFKYYRTYRRYIFFSLKDNKLFRSHGSVGRDHFLCLLMEGSRFGSVKMITDPDTETSFQILNIQVVSIEGEGYLTHMTKVFAKLFQSRQHVKILYEFYMLYPTGCTVPMVSTN